MKTLLAAVTMLAINAQAMEFQTRYAAIRLDEQGLITSIAARTPGKEYSPAGHPSPLLSLHESGKPNDALLSPVSATLRGEEIALRYAGGAVAVVKAKAQPDYIRFQLLSLDPRGTVDGIVWGPVHTCISKIMGDIIGVVRDDDFAIGLMGVDDNTIPGPLTDGDCYGMGYFVHSPDPTKYPLDPKYKEGQQFNIGGDGVSDVAFYSRPEEYFQQTMGSGAKLDPEFGSTIAYSARDRRQPRVHLFSLLPGFQRSRPRHMVSDPVADVDFIGSTVALYACPDDQGPATLEKIVLAEGMPHIVIDGKWVRDPSAYRPTLWWNGTHDKAIEYAKAMGFKLISRDTGEFYASRPNQWVGRVGFSNGKTLSYKEFAEECHRQGLSHGGLHTLCLFLQGGISSDVTPVPSPNLQTVCRVKLAKDLSPTDPGVVVAEPSFLTEDGTWPLGDSLNYARIGTEMIKYNGISDKPPYTLQNVKRGHASTAVAHKAGDELAKLQMNCYHGFVPDMQLLLDYADYYADLMARNGMDQINFDGYESLMYQNHGYYAMRRFNRRLFETYHRLTGGRYPRVTGSCVFPGAWEYMSVCDVGGGGHMFDPTSGRRGIEGKDIIRAFSNSYFPGTFGGQGWQPSWSLYDAENLMAKAIGWEATFALSTSQDAIDSTGEKDAIFAAFRAWQSARESRLFSKSQRAALQDPDLKHHIEQTGEHSFVLYPIRPLIAEGTTPASLVVTNPYAAQPLDCAIQFLAPADGATITLPGGQSIQCSCKLDKNQFVIFKGPRAYVANGNRVRLADLPLPQPAGIQGGDSAFRVETPAPVRVRVTVWARGKGEPIGG